MLPPKHVHISQKCKQRLLFSVRPVTNFDAANVPIVGFMSVNSSHCNGIVKLTQSHTAAVAL